jgi:hypothetical protein
LKKISVISLPHFFLENSIEKFSPVRPSGNHNQGRFPEPEAFSGLKAALTGSSGNDPGPGFRYFGTFSSGCPCKKIDFLFLATQIKWGWKRQIVYQTPDKDSNF